MMEKGEFFREKYVHKKHFQWVNSRHVKLLNSLIFKDLHYFYLYASMTYNICKIFNHEYDNNNDNTDYNY